MIKNRCIVLADSHGKTHLITNVLEHADYNSDKDRLVFAGDFLDIGPHGRECLEILLQNNAEILIGNHEASVLLHHPIGPQNDDSWLLFGRLLRMRSREKLKIAALHDNVLITHAGLSSVYYKKYNNLSLQEILDDLNKNSNNSIEDLEILEQFWNDNSPLWYRPGKSKPYPGITQIVGHSPISYVKKYYPQFDLTNFYMIDPWSPTSLGKDRYRYAIIEKGVVNIKRGGTVI